MVEVPVGTRITAGTRWPLRGRLSADLYYMHQDDRRSAPEGMNVVYLALHLDY